MDTTTVVSTMCREELSAADIQAICRNRGFSARDAASPKLLENLLLSETGLAAVLAGLSREEITLLHLLKALASPVDVAVFGRIHGASQRGSFTERYKETFKKLRATIIRRGLVFFSDPGANHFDKKAKLERYRFVFPREFHSFLPPLFETITRHGGPGEVNDSFPRGMLREVIGHPSRSEAGQPAPADHDGICSITNGELRFGEKRFTVEALRRWQRAAWAAAQPKAVKNRTGSPGTMGQTEAATYALSQLGPGEWVEAEALAPVFKVFCHGREISEPGEIVDRGWRCGLLTRARIEGKNYYRLPDENASDSPQPDGYLSPDREAGVFVDLSRIPYQALADLAHISRFSRIGSQLAALPDRVEIGRHFSVLGPLAGWLREKIPAYGRVFDEVESRWGRQVVHENLCVAEVRDLSLMVAIEKAFSGRGVVVSLSRECIAFHPGLEPEIASVVKKAGFVVKTVTA